MPRIRRHLRESRSDPRRLLPILARAFAKLGYRRATTAQLARRCGVRENILYRSWPSKKEMFIASIGYVFDNSLRIWREIGEDNLPRSRGAPRAAGLVLEYEAAHHGEFGLYRIVFAALGELGDPEIRAALRAMYAKFHDFIASLLPAAPARRVAVGGADRSELAWALVGLGTVRNVARELDLLDAERGRSLMRDVGHLLLKGAKR